MNGWTIFKTWRGGSASTTNTTRPTFTNTGVANPQFPGNATVGVGGGAFPGAATTYPSAYPPGATFPASTTAPTAAGGTGVSPIYDNA